MPALNTNSRNLRKYKISEKNFNSKKADKNKVWNGEPIRKDENQS